MPPPVTARGFGGALIAHTVGSGAFRFFAFAFIYDEIHSDIQYIYIT